jgi:hypothetical protein
MAAIANVALSDTFNTQRVKLNRGLVRLNNFANNESQLTANVIFANVAITASGNLTSSGTRTLLSSVNTNITGGSLLISSNTYVTGTLELNGLTATTSNSVAGAITEVSDNTIAFSIALG